MPQRPRILVTGCAGYIGTTLVPLLLSEGFIVRGVDSLIYGDYGMASFRAHPDFEWMPGDIRDARLCFDAVRDCSAVIHLAGTSGDQACNADMSACYQTNYIGTELLVRASEYGGVDRFCFASSCSVYGAASDWVDESSTPHPLTLYARTKLDAESLVVSANLRCPTAFRLSTVFGISGRTRLDLVLNQMSMNAVTRKTLIVYGGQQWRPILCVHDVARAFLLWLQLPPEQTARQVINIGADHLNVRIAELADRVAAVLPEVTLDLRPLEQDFRSYRVSFRKARDLLGFAPQHSIEDGVREIANAIASGVISEPRHPQYSTIGRRL
ncbi:MAG: NAD-dependent epimerase/dehydratase family protein [bacterium JZ-2024 1]